MAHKRYQKDLRGVSHDDPAFWEEQLRREGLTPDAGRNHKLVYVGGPVDLERIQNKVEAGTEGEVEELRFG